jgi:phage terminase large subunit
MSAQFDFRNPDYDAVIRDRYKRIQKLKASSPSQVSLVKTYYRDHIAQFICDFGMTFDPRVIADGRDPFMPFVLFPKQMELVDYVVRKWQNSEPGVIVKSRDVGVSWIAMAVACSLCLFYRNMAIGVGSATQDKLDRSDDPDCLFYKGRQFMRYIPVVFKGAWNIDKDCGQNKIIFRENGSSITGEVGDRIGRGGRKAIYFVDEAAHLERPKKVDHALSATTRCRIDMSSVNGMANSFAERAHNPNIERFEMTWRDDARKDEDWYNKQKQELDPITVKQEIDCSFLASVEGIVIDPEWIQSAIDSDKKLGLDLSGKKHGAFDVADEGKDKNAYAGRCGLILEHVECWSGKGSDPFISTERVFNLCDEWKVPSFAFDNDGIGANVRGDSRVINDRRESQGYRRVTVESFRGSGEVIHPEREMVKGRGKNKDFFQNFKAQSWWHLRLMFQNTARAIAGKPYDPQLLITIRTGTYKDFDRMLIELCQPVYTINTAGKILIDKSPDGVASPNLADAVMMVYAPRKLALKISDEALHG